MPVAVIRVVVSGDKQLIRKLQMLAASAQRRVVRPAANKAWTPVNKEAKRRCPVETGALKRSIGKRTQTYPRLGVVRVDVGARTGKKYHTEGPDGRMRKPTKYAHWVEFGTAHSSAKPFLRPAFDTKRSEAQRIMERTCWERLGRLNRK